MPVRRTSQVHGHVGYAGACSFQKKSQIDGFVRSHHQSFFCLQLIFFYGEVFDVIGEYREISGEILSR